MGAEGPRADLKGQRIGGWVGRRMFVGCRLLVEPPRVQGAPYFAFKIIFEMMDDCWIFLVGDETVRDKTHRK